MSIKYIFDGNGRVVMQGITKNSIVFAKLAQSFDTSTEISSSEIIFEFTSVNSVTVLIDKLHEIKRNLLKEG